VGPDLVNPKWMCLKAIGFVLIAFLCALGLMLRSMRIETAVLILLLVWASARAYYFCFYVIERYINPEFKFAGLSSAVAFLLKSDRVNDQDA
jgi:hypothetical protein